MDRCLHLFRESDNIFYSSNWKGVVSDESLRHLLNSNRVGYWWVSCRGRISDKQYAGCCTRPYIISPTLIVAPCQEGEECHSHQPLTAWPDYLPVCNTWWYGGGKKHPCLRLILFFSFFLLFYLRHWPGCYFSSDKGILLQKQTCC